MRISKFRLLALFSVLAAMFLTAACGGNSSESDEANAQAIADGLKIYETGGASQVPCLTCHTLDGTELVGPSFQGVGERAGTRIDGLSAEEYLRQSIREPHAFLVPGYEATMPTNYPELLSDEDIENVIAFLLSQ